MISASGSRLESYFMLIFFGYSDLAVGFSFLMERDPVFKSRIPLWESIWAVVKIA
jgi:hypothetical protein